MTSETNNGLLSYIGTQEFKTAAEFLASSGWKASLKDQKSSTVDHTPDEIVVFEEKPEIGILTPRVITFRNGPDGNVNASMGYSIDGNLLRERVQVESITIEHGTFSISGQSTEVTILDTRKTNPTPGKKPLKLTLNNVGGFKEEDTRFSSEDNQITIVNPGLYNHR
ncbi:MAG TPA: hypothetical protein VG917_04690 [Patescibacteria group bacterium]|nr:hypothetical protein [Patescibacteria group bacterium]